jgi:flagellar basal-body rod modification protein FlgD
MTSQITQMTGVEQQLVTNDLLAALVGMSTGGGISEGVNLMGKQVTAETDKSVLKNKEATWSYTQSRSATGVKIEVSTSSARSSPPSCPTTCRAATTPSSGTARDAGGVQQPDGGEYTIKVTATDADGTNITTTSKGRIDGIVTKVTNSGVNMVWIGDTKVAAGLGDRRHQPHSADANDNTVHGRGLTVTPDERASE